MKIHVSIKDPDGFYEAVADYAQGDDAKAEEMNEALKPWVAHGEYVTLEFDLASGEAKVLRRASG